MPFQKNREKMHDSLTKSFNGNHCYAGKCKPKIKVTTSEGITANGSVDHVSGIRVTSSLAPETSSPKAESAVSFSCDDDYSSEINLASDLFTRGLDHDLVAPLPIYNLWKRKFGSDEDTAQRKWRQFSESSLKSYYAFNEKLQSLEDIVHTSLTLKNVNEKDTDMEIVFNQIEELDKEISDVTQNLQYMANYIPLGIHRNNIKQRIQSVRRRYFSLLKELNRKREILRHVIPRMERRKYQEKEIKTWLDLAETRLCDIPDYYNTKLVLEKHDIIEHIASEMESKFDIYAAYIDTCKSILHLLEFNDLSIELHDICERWDQLSANMDDLLCRVEMYKKLASFNDSACDSDKSDKERSDLTCYSDFKIINDNESWKILTNKEVRLVRLHGNTIVVRVGGGWEYLYDFLLRVDPDRGKYINGNDGQVIDAIGLRGLYLSPTEKKQIQEFTMSVERKMWKSWTSVTDIADKTSHSSDEDSGILCESK